MLRIIKDSPSKILRRAIAMIKYFQLDFIYPPLPLNEVASRSLGASTGLKLINKRLEIELVNFINLYKKSTNINKLVSKMHNITNNKVLNYNTVLVNY